MSDSHSHVTEASGIQEEEDMRPAMTRSEQSVTEGEKDVRKNSGIQTSLNHNLEALSVQVCTDSQLFRILKWEKWHEVKLKMNYSWILTNACCNSVNIVAATILPLLLSQMKFSRNESLLQAQAEEVRFSN